MTWLARIRRELAVERVFRADLIRLGFTSRRAAVVDWLLTAVLLGLSLAAVVAFMFMALGWVDG